MAGKYQKSGQAKLRARYHDMNSTRRNRNQRTVSWEEYQARTRGGRKEYRSGTKGRA